MRNVVDQANYRHYNLPEGSHQSIYIDVRGQNYTQDMLNSVEGKVLEGVVDGVSIDVNFITE